MPRWHSLFLASAIIAAAAPAAADDMPSLLPAAQQSILEGAKACLGSTLDPDAQPGRFKSWTAAAPERVRDMKSDGTLVTKDNVMIAYKPGKDGGCVVMAASDAKFDSAAFFAQLSKVVGASIAKAEKPAPIDLPDGELIVPVVVPKSAPDAPDIILVFANRAGQFGKKKGN